MVSGPETTLAESDLSSELTFALMRLPLIGWTEHNDLNIPSLKLYEKWWRICEISMLTIFTEFHQQAPALNLLEALLICGGCVYILVNFSGEQLLLEYMQLCSTS